MPAPKLQAVRTLRRKTAARVHDFRYSLSYVDALPQLIVLGLLSGLAAAGVIVAFRLLVDAALLGVLNGRDDFEALSPEWRFALPLVGAMLIGLCWHFLSKADRAVSVSHVLDRLHNHQGRLPWRNVVAQFLGGAASLISGQSVGREGPAVHLGAGTASLLGQWLRLPHNSLRTLVACGVAAAIAASFNTPMAGVIFAMEVVLMEYSITSFLPVILASVSGAVVTQVVFGEHSSFTVKPVQMASLLELPFMAMLGLVIAALAAVFSKLQLSLYRRQQQLPCLVRFTIIGAITGSLALLVPEVLGLGYDTLEAAMLGQVSLQVLLALVAAKILATAVSTGLGMPGGVIGPTLVIGGCIGGALGIAGNSLYPDAASNAGFYVTLGMAAMMAAVLNAPLAALIAILELTYNPNVIFPSMVVIVVACVMTQQLFRSEGLFTAQLRAAGTPLRSEPARQVLSRVGVVSVMNRSFAISQAVLSLNDAYELLKDRPLWIVVEGEQDEKFLLRATDLANFLESYQPEASEITEEGEAMVNLMEIPAQRFQLYSLHPQANLYEANQLLQQSYGEAICIEEVSTTTPLRSPVVGVITQAEIENYYAFEQ